MRLVLRYFAAIRDALGRESETCVLDDVSTVGEAIVALARRDRALDTALADFPRARFAVNHRFATRATPLADGDELAVFPPVTGG